MPRSTIEACHLLYGYDAVQSRAAHWPRLPATAFRRREQCFIMFLSACPILSGARKFYDAALEPWAIRDFPRVTRGWAMARNNHSFG